MEQLKSYLSRQRHLGNVLVLGGGQNRPELTWYLEHERKASSVAFCEKKDVDALRHIMAAARIDALLFTEGWAETVKQLAGSSLRYLIGRIAPEEDYFGVWEGYRTGTKHIYMDRERSGPRMRDVDRYEVLEWEQAESPVELSVIIPVYNVCAYLGECMESLLQWKAPYVEYLFVDDGSTDGSSELIDRYAAADERVRHIRKDNGGCASARNLGLKRAEGRYVGFVDGDDFVDGQMFRKLLSRALMGNYELAYCGYREYDEGSGETRKVMNDCMTEPYLTGTYRADQVQKLMIRTRVAIWRCIYRKKLLDREGLTFHESLPRFDDLPFKIESGFRAESAVCVPEYLYYYRLGRQGQDVSGRDERLFVHFEIFRILDQVVVPMKNQRLIDYLQIVKLHTHGYALGRIDRKYYRRYLRMAGAQMDETGGTMRTLCLMLFYGGRSNIGWYLKSVRKGRRGRR